MGNRFVCCLLATVILAACQEPEVDPLEGLPELSGLSPDPARLPGPPAAAATPPTVSVRHILCSYEGALKTRKGIKRNREQARQRAGHLLKMARAKGQDFVKLARKFSDDVRNSRDGGSLGLINRGDLHPDLENAAFALGINQVSGVVESPRGFHILCRHPPEHAQAAEILVSYKGAKRHTPRKPRNREQAKALAERILDRLNAGASFEAEVLAHSDHPNLSKGGYYPIFKKGSRLPKFEEIVFGLGIGKHSGVVETPTGFHIVKRLPPQKIQVRHIEINYLKPTDETAEDQKGTRQSHQEALSLIHQAYRAASVPGTDFAALVPKFSDGLDRNRGGLKEPFGRGRYAYSFESAAFGLEVGEISDIVETDTGFHVIKRIR